MVAGVFGNFLFEKKWAHFVHFSCIVVSSVTMEMNLSDYQLITLRATANEVRVYQDRPTTVIRVGGNVLMVANPRYDPALNWYVDDQGRRLGNCPLCGSVAVLGGVCVNGFVTCSLPGAVVYATPCGNFGIHPGYFQIARFIYDDDETSTFLCPRRISMITPRPLTAAIRASGVEPVNTEIYRIILSLSGYLDPVGEDLISVGQ